MPTIKILLFGIPRMLSDMVAHAVKTEPDMRIVEHGHVDMHELSSLSKRRRIDVVIFRSGDQQFSEPAIARLLHQNPRLGLLGIDSTTDQSTLHHVAPARENISPLAHASVVRAIRTGAMLRLSGP